MIRPWIVTGAVVVAIISGCAQLPEYRWPNPVNPAASAAGFIEFLKRDRYREGQLDNFPDYAIILYDSDPEAALAALGYRPEDYKSYELGYTMPNRVYLVGAQRQHPAFALNVGTPGAGGVSTQASELAALGATHIVHMGTCMALGESDLPGLPWVSAGSYKDGAAWMLTPPERAESRISEPDADFSRRIASAFPSARRGIGYTVPVIYHQPESLLRHFLTDGRIGSNPPIEFVEMEQSAFFETCHREGVACASVVVASDATVLVDGAVVARFAEGETLRDARRDALTRVLDAFAADVRDSPQ